jgi:hypothetical protein
LLDDEEQRRHQAKRRDDPKTPQLLHAILSNPFVLSLSKHCPSSCQEEQHFDKLNANGEG